MQLGALTESRLLFSQKNTKCVCTFLGARTVVKMGRSTAMQYIFRTC